MAGWILLGLVVAAAAAFVLLRTGSYRRLFADEHFIAIGRGARSLKAAALARVIQTDDDAPTSPSDPRILTTPAGLAVVYTVAESGSGFVHHCSVSVVGGYTGNAIGGTFVVFVMKVIGLPIERSKFEIGASTVHHGEVTLDQTEHDDLVCAPTTEVSSSNVDELRRAAFDARSGIQWKRAASTGG
jgi:hypothetical protein